MATEKNVGQASYSAEEHAETPKAPSSNWFGILITISPTTGFIHGRYHIKGSDYPVDDRLIVEAISAADQSAYQGVLGQLPDDNLIEPAPAVPEPDPSVVKRMIFSGFFNADLREAVGLPAAAGKYRVRVHMGQIKSNEISIRLKN